MLSWATMRLIVVVGVVGLASPVFADRYGGGGGGGRLGQVTSGVDAASAAGSSGASSSEVYASTPIYVERDAPSESTTATAPRPEPPGPPATLTGFAGAQKVVGSDGSLSVSLSAVDKHLRFNGSFTQYYENEMNGGRVTMMAPELSLGVPLGAEAPTRVWLEGGAMYLRTNDPSGGSSVAGPTLGTRIEHQVSPDLSYAGAIEAAYLADGVHGVQGRIGVRFHHVEAAFRVLDLNVGPALYGPEVGVGF
jgi:hypothetical protein